MTNQRQGTIAREIPLSLDILIFLENTMASTSTCPILKMPAQSFARLTQVSPHRMQCLAPHTPFATHSQNLAQALSSNLANPEVFFSMPILPSASEGNSLHNTLTSLSKVLKTTAEPKIFVRWSAIKSPYINRLDVDSLAILTEQLKLGITTIAQQIAPEQNAATVFAKLNVVLVDNQEMLGILGYTENGEKDQAKALAALPVWLQHDGTVVLNAQSALNHDALSKHTKEALSLAFKLCHAQYQQDLQNTFENTEPNTEVLGAKGLGHLAQSVFTQLTWAAQGQTGNITPPPAYQKAASQAHDFIKLATSPEGKLLGNIKRLLTLGAVQQTALGLDAFFEQAPGFFLSAINRIKFVSEPGQSSIAYAFGRATEKHLELPKNVSKAFTSHSALQQHLVLVLTQTKQDFRLMYCPPSSHVDLSEVINMAKLLLPEEQLRLLLDDISTSTLSNALGRWVVSSLNPNTPLGHNPGNEYAHQSRISLFSELDAQIFDALLQSHGIQHIANIFLKPQEQTLMLDSQESHGELCLQYQNSNQSQERATAYAHIMEGLYKLREQINPNNPMAVTLSELLEHSQAEENSRQTLRTLLVVIGISLFSLGTIHHTSSFPLGFRLAAPIVISSAATVTVQESFGTIASVAYGISIAILMILFLWQGRAAHQP